SRDGGVMVVEAEEVEEAAAAEPIDDEEEERQPSAAHLPVKQERSTEVGERTDDPVRMYLREMGSVELLSREGEIAIAKRIEAGREKMIGALCESPLTMKAIVQWREDLLNKKVLLRDIIDLEGTYNGPIPDNSANPPGPPPTPAQQIAAARAAAAARVAQDIKDRNDKEREKEERAKAEAATKKAVKKDEDYDPLIDDIMPEQQPEEPEEEDEANLSLAAKEAQLMPDVVEALDEIARIYKKLQKLQEERLAILQRGHKIE